MNNIKIFRLFGILTLISLYFLILAGGIVRTTGSGMGCPDWPKCFGHYIPPSDLSEVSFTPNHQYSKKVFIIYNNRLWFSKESFTSSSSINLEDWQEFTDHSHTEFNATHTWIEALNRYLGVFVGFFVLGMFVYAFILYRRNHTNGSKYKNILFFSFIALIFVIIQGVIGKYLVSSNLKLQLLTVHMLFSYTVLFAVILVLYNTSKESYSTSGNNTIYRLLILVIVLTTIQTVLGTQVTANVEHNFKLGISRDIIISTLDFRFYIHRSFSILLLLANVALVYNISKSEKDQYFVKLTYLILFILFIEMFLGVILNYFGYPKFAQPLHLLLATIIIGGQFYLFIIYHNSLKLLNK